MMDIVDQRKDRWVVWNMSIGAKEASIEMTADKLSYRKHVEPTS